MRMFDMLERVSRWIDRRRDWSGTLRATIRQEIRETEPKPKFKMGERVLIDDQESRVESVCPVRLDDGRLAYVYECKWWKGCARVMLESEIRKADESA